MGGVGCYHAHDSRGHCDIPDPGFFAEVIRFRSCPVSRLICCGDVGFIYLSSLSASSGAHCLLLFARDERYRGHVGWPRQDMSTTPNEITAPNAGRAIAFLTFSWSSTSRLSSAWLSRLRRFHGMRWIRAPWPTAWRRVRRLSASFLQSAVQPITSLLIHHKKSAETKRLRSTLGVSSIVLHLLRSPYRRRSLTSGV
jgi:hypothetical protein